MRAESDGLYTISLLDIIHHRVPKGCLMFIPLTPSARNHGPEDMNGRIHPPICD